MKINHPLLRLLSFLLLLTSPSFSAFSETLPPLDGSAPPQTWEQLWAGFDPRAEPLDVEILKEWEEDGVVLRVLRYRVGIFKGRKAMMAAVYGFPKGQRDLPGLVQIHGGGQYADYRACLTNAKRGYATISIAWAGRISAPGYNVPSNVVKLFWDAKTDNPHYKITTDWGALDGYHAPSRSGRDAFNSLPADDWTLDPVASPRNSSWFLGALAARRALTFLEQQPQVDRRSLGVYGHSMGGKYTVLTAAADKRVKAAAPSCGGISERGNANPLHCETVGDAPNLQRITCPILFLSPSNDFHGRINDLPTALNDIRSKDWRITASPHHNHQDTAEYETATLLWFDQHLKHQFRLPRSPRLNLSLAGRDGTPRASARIDSSMPVLSVDIYYTQQGQIDGKKDSRNNTMNRFWRCAPALRKGGEWTADLPLVSTELPLWAYVNVTYALDKPLTSAGYYYAVRDSDRFVLSSPLRTALPSDLQAAGARAVLSPDNRIEDFSTGWQKQWFNYRDGWARSTHKLNDPQWKAPQGAKLALQVSSEQPNKMVIKLDSHAAEVSLAGGSVWEAIELAPADFHNAAGQALNDFQGIRELRLSPAETLRAKDQKPLSLGGSWQGPDPVFNDLHWMLPPAEPAKTTASAGQPGQPHDFWTYKTVDGKELQLSVFLPEGYHNSSQSYPAFVVYHGGSWAVGDPNWHYPDCAYWSRRGMVALSVRYRLSKRDGVQVPLECVKDAKSAIRYLRQNAQRLKIDPNRIVAAGGSAGGQLAAATATLTASATNDDCYDPAISCVPNAVILYNPYFKCEPALSPPNFLRPGLPPFITFLGDEDPAIPVQGLLDFHQALKAHAVPSEYYVGKGGKHGFCNGRNPRNPFFYWSLELEDRFLVKHRILRGESQVNRPQGVAHLLPETGFDSYL